MAEYEEYQAYDEYYDEPQGNRRMWLIVAIVVVILLLCCCCLVLVAGIALLGQDIANELQSIAGGLPALAGVTALV